MSAFAATMLALCEGRYVFFEVKVLDSISTEPGVDATSIPATQPYAVGSAVESVKPMNFWDKQASEYTPKDYNIPPG